MSRMLGIAGVQMEVGPGDNRDNMARQLAGLVAKHPWVELVLFSELCSFGPDMKFAEPIPGPTLDLFRDLARTHRVWLAPGSIYERTGNGVYNTVPIIDPDGRLVTQYRKIFPWRPYETALPGREFCTFDLPGRGRVGLCTCYDQWFPEVVRQLTWMGAEIILNPTMTVTDDRPLELILSRANAICNQVYFFSVNGLGHGGIGSTVLVDPEGTVLDQAGREEGVVAARIDLDRVSEVRREGTLGFCQVLKSLRDHSGTFPVYVEGLAAGPGFKDLGPISEKKLKVPGV
ncbi:MAG: carbon-nitrogen hydrolase family protein [Thermodesulfobacteriota bacterium]